MGQLINEQGNLQFFPTQFTPDDWLEAVGFYSPATNNITTRKSYTTLTGYIFGQNKVLPCLQYLLGYSFVETTSGDNTLARKLPSYHPFYDWMWCTGVTEVTGIKWNGKEESIYDPPGLAYATYDLYRVTASYEPLPWNIRWDYWGHDQEPYPDPEWTRYVQMTQGPYVQTITFDNGCFWFDAPTRSWDNAPVSAKITFTRLQKQGIKLVWYQVPETFVSNKKGIYSRLAAMEKTVNEQKFMGFSPQTLYCEKINSFDNKYVSPLTSLLQESQQYTLDIHFDLTYFEPTPDPVYAGVLRGHNLVPGYDGAFYGTKFPTGAGIPIGIAGQPRPMFKSNDWNKAFQYAGDDV